MLQNKVRIIGGRWRRQLLSFPDGAGLRPTPDRVRETLFNWLGQDLYEQSCLDLFAGSGALGFEAASRGAARVVLVELSRPVQQALLASKTKLAADTVQVIASDARSFLNHDGQRYDIIFVDPPFASPLAAQVLPLLPARLNAGGMVYLECAESPDLSGWSVHRQGTAGKVHYFLLKLGKL